MSRNLISLLIVITMARDANYWSARRGKQGGRFGKKLGQVYDSPSVKNVAQAAWSGVKYLRTLVNSEVMKFDIAPANATVSSTPALIMDMTAIAQGDGIGQRTGNSILNTGFYSNLALTKNATATFTFVRIVVVIDRQQVADTAPVWTDIFESASTYAKISATTMGRFKILYDKRILLSTQRDYKMINIYKKFKSLHTRYNGVATSDIQKNGIYMFAVSSEAVNTPTLLYTNRTYYHDN